MRTKGLVLAACLVLGCGDQSPSTDDKESAGISHQAMSGGLPDLPALQYREVTFARDVSDYIPLPTPQPLTTSAPSPVLKRANHFIFNVPTKRNVTLTFTVGNTTAPSNPGISLKVYDAAGTAIVSKTLPSDFGNQNRTTQVQLANLSSGNYEADLAPVDPALTYTFGTTDVGVIPALKDGADLADAGPFLYFYVPAEVDTAFLGGYFDAATPIQLFAPNSTTPLTPGVVNTTTYSFDTRGKPGVWSVKFRTQFSAAHLVNLPNVFSFDKNAVITSKRIRTSLNLGPPPSSAVTTPYLRADSRFVFHVTSPSAPTVFNLALENSLVTSPPPTLSVKVVDLTGNQIGSVFTVPVAPSTPVNVGALPAADYELQVTNPVPTSRFKVTAPGGVNLLMVDDIAIGNVVVPSSRNYFFVSGTKVHFYSSNASSPLTVYNPSGAATPSPTLLGNNVYEINTTPGTWAINAAGATSIRFLDIPQVIAFDPTAQGSPLFSGVTACATNADCRAGQVCGVDNGAHFGRTGSDDICWLSTCGTSQAPPDSCGSVLSQCGTCNCTADGTHCGVGEGPCSSSTQCQPGLICVADNLSKRGARSGNACAPVHCGNGSKDADETSIDCGASCGEDCTVRCDRPNGDASHCSTDCPCTAGEGDCDSAAECQAGLVCGTANGAAFGLSTSTDVCVASTCQNGVKDGTEAAVDCGGSCAPCAPPAAGPVAVATNGSALLNIVISNHSDPNVHAAVLAIANDLRDKLNQIVSPSGGTPFAIPTSNNVPSGISLGIDGDFAGAGWPYQGYFRPNDVLAGGMLRPDRLALQEQYVLRTAQGSSRVIVAGASVDGLRDAVWDMLKQVGYRHYFATPTWEVTPAQPSLSLNLAVDEKPAFFSRTINMPGNTAWETAFNTVTASQYSDWLKHNRLYTGAATADLLGSTLGYSKVVQYWEQRHGVSFPPELSTDPTKTLTLRQFCLTGVADVAGVQWTIDSVVREWAAAQTTSPLSLSPIANISWASAVKPDGSLYCKDVNDPTYGNVANRMVAILNAAAAVQPTKPITATLLADVTDAPTLALRQNVFVNLRNRNAAVTPFALENRLKDWSAPSFEVGVEDYWGGSSGELPGQDWRNSDHGLAVMNLSAKSAVDRVGAFYQVGARRYTVDNNWGWGLSGPAWWTTAQVLWDADAPRPEAEYRADFLQNAFGSAAPAMSKFYGVVENRALWSENLIGVMYRSLQEAFTLSTDPGVQNRLTDLGAYTRYLELTRKFWNRCSAQASGTTEQTELKQAMQLAYATRDRRIFESRDAMQFTLGEIAACPTGSTCTANGCAIGSSLTGVPCVLPEWGVTCPSATQTAACGTCFGSNPACNELKTAAAPTAAQIRAFVDAGAASLHVLPSGLTREFSQDLVPYTPPNAALPLKVLSYTRDPFYLLFQRPKTSGGLAVHLKKVANAQALAGQLSAAANPSVALDSRIFGGTDIETDWSFNLVSNDLFRLDLDDRNGAMFTTFPTGTRFAIPAGPKDPGLALNYRYSAYFVVPKGTPNVVGWSQADGAFYRYSASNQTAIQTGFLADYAVGSACTNPRTLVDTSLGGGLHDHFVIPVASPPATTDEIWYFTDGGGGTIGDRVLLNVPPYLYAGPDTILVPREVSPETTNPITCSTSASCPSGQFCTQGGTCRSNTDSCTLTAECASGKGCQSGQCQCSTCSASCTCSSGGICQTNTDCNIGLSCVAGKCADTTNGGGLGDPCSGTVACVAGLACVNQQCAPNCVANPNDPACIAARCSNGVKDGNETDVDCGGSCTACSFDFGHECSSTTSCKSGLTCAVDAGPRFGLRRGTDVCIDPSCITDPQLLGCGNGGDRCGRNCENVVACDSNSNNCPLGESCYPELPVNAVLRYSGICAPSLCATAASSHCGASDSECGECVCKPSCEGKQCGASDGCGGTCRHLCGAGEVCSDDSACQSGMVCGRGIGSRFGLAVGTSACWPAKCADGLVSSSCPGNQPTACEGPFCEACAVGSYPSDGTCAVSILSLRPDGSNFPDPIDPRPTDANGGIKGTFNVSARGTAEYSIPIDVPPGRLGLQPALTLAYSSTKRDGMLGIGWNLTGLPTISRCRRIIDRDGRAEAVTFDHHDRFCLDNLPLIQVPHVPTETYGANGAEYRTEIDSFTKVMAFGGSDEPLDYSGPRYFKAWTKDGRILTFGESGNASVFVGERPDGFLAVKRIWAVNAVEDRVGNLISIQYEPHQTVGTGRYGSHTTDTIEDTGELLPKVIAYGGRRMSQPVLVPWNRQSRSVRFEYEERPDAIHHYLSGVQGFSNHRVKRIDTYVEDGVVKTYKLDYGAASHQLVRLKECAPDAATHAEVCKNETNVEYFSHREAALSHDLFVGVVSPVRAPIVLDTNGDGQDEVLTGESETSTSPSGGPSIFNWQLMSLRIAETGERIPEKQEGAVEMPAYQNPYTETIQCLSQESVVDLDRDGRDDLAYRCAGAYGLPEHFLNWFKYDGLRWVKQTPVVVDEFKGAARFADVNGDGLKDLVWCDNVSPTGTSGTIRFAKNNSLPGLYGVSFGPSETAGAVGPCKYMDIIDVDGDGADDIVHTATNGAVVVYSAEARAFQGIAPGFAPSMRDRPPSLADVNGDGLKDIVSDYSNSKIRLLVNTGRTFEEQLIDKPAGDVTGASIYGFVSDAVIADVDGNGTEDFVSRTGWTEYSGVGKLLFHQMPVFADVYHPDSYQQRGVLADLDGDGDPEYVYDYAQKYLDSIHSSRAKLLHRVTDGFGKAFKVTYDGWSSYGDNKDPNPRLRRTYPANYTCQNPNDRFTCARRVGPVVDYSREINVVSQADGPAFERQGVERHYSYRNFRIGLAGRGSFGFESRSISLGQLSTTTESYLNRDFRTAGHLLATSTSFGAAAADSGAYGSKEGSCVSSQLEWGVRGGIAPQTWFAYVKTQDDFEGHPAQSLCNWVTHRNSTVADDSVDVFGNVTERKDIVETRGPGGVTAINRTYTTPRENRIGEWLVGLLDFASLEEVRAGETLVRNTNYEYDSHGLLQSVEREPGDPDSTYYQQITIERDEVGMPRRSCVRDRDGVETERCIEVLSRDEYRILPKQVRNAGGLVSEFEFSARDGQLLVSRDPNSLLSEFSYDAFGRPQVIRTPTGRSELSYRRVDLVATEFDAVYVTGAMATIEDKLGEGTTTTTYDADGRVVATKTSGFDTDVYTEREFDEFGRVILETLPHEAEDVSQGFNRYSYDNASRLSTVTGPTGVETHYDQVDYLTADAAHRSWFNNTDGAWAVVERKPRGNIHVAIRDALGDIARIVDAADRQRTDEAIADFHRGALGHLVQVDTPDAVVTFEPDLLGRTGRSVDPALGTRRFEYNGFDEVVATIDAKLTQLSHTYDDLGRPLETLDEFGNVLSSFEYDGDGANELGKLVSTTRQAMPGTNVVNATRIQYASAAGLVSEVEHRVDAIADVPDASGAVYHVGYQYGSDGVPWRLSRIDYPDVGGAFAVELAYKSTGHLDRVHKPGAPNDFYWHATGADQGIRLAEERFGNGAISTHQYYSLENQSHTCDLAVEVCIPGDLQSITTESSNSVVQDVTYGYDANGNVASVAPVGSAPLFYSYEYDGMDRLHRQHLVNASGDQITDFAYTPGGALTYKTDIGSYNHSDHRLDAGENAYKFDANGNQWERSGPQVVGGYQKIAYNELDMPFQVRVGSPTGPATEFEYEASGTRVVTREAVAGGTKLVHSVDELYDRIAAPGMQTVNRYRIYAGDRAVAEVTRPDNGVQRVAYLHADRLHRFPVEKIGRV